MTSPFLVGSRFGWRSLFALPWLLVAPLSAAQTPPEPEPAEVAPLPPRDGDNPRVNVEKARWRPGKGLELVSEDGRFRLVTRLRAQFLYIAEHTFEGPEQPRDFQNAFLLRRVRIVFAGHMFGEHNKFKMELAVAPPDLGFTDLSGDDDPPIVARDTVPTRSLLLDMYMEFDYLRDLTLLVGQYKVPFSRQRVISSGDLMLVDRALANSEFNLDRDIGVELRSEDLFGLGHLRYYVGAYIGEGHSAYALQEFGLMTLARVEVLPFGMFEDYSEADLERHDSPHLSLGVAVAHIDDAKGTRGILGRRPRDRGTTDYDVLTADFFFKWRGLSAHSEYFLRRGTRNPGTALDSEGQPLPVEPPGNGWGWFLQAGYLLPGSSLELSGRYSLIRPSGAPTRLTPQNEAGLGLSYYFHGHPFKLQADYFRLWSQRPSEGDNQFRLQLQTSF